MKSLAMNFVVQYRSEYRWVSKDWFADTLAHGIESVLYAA